MEETASGYWSSHGEPTGGDPSTWGLSEILTLHRKEQTLIKWYIGPRHWTHSLARSGQLKMDMRFGTWKF